MGDLVLDPTCGSGTTATVAEQWGRRWITIDTSRVALALAQPGTKLTWTQASPRSEDPALTATVTVAEADAAAQEAQAQD